MLILQVKHKFPHIEQYDAFRIPISVDVAKLLKNQLAVVCFDGKDESRLRSYLDYDATN